MFFLFVTADTDLVRAQTICGGDTHVSPLDRTKRMKTNGAQQAGAASRYPALARDSGYLPWYVNSTKLTRPDQCAAPRGKGTRPRALTAEALPPPYGIAYDARPPTVDLISSSSSL